MCKADFEYRQMKINRSTMQDIIKVVAPGEYGYNSQLVKVCDDHGNFVIYYSRKNKCFYSLAKPESGCRNSYYGDIYHVKHLLRQGYLKYKDFTKYGLRLVGFNKGV